MKGTCWLVRSHAILLGQPTMEAPQVRPDQVELGCPRVGGFSIEKNGLFSFRGVTPTQELSKNEHGQPAGINDPIKHPIKHHERSPSVSTVGGLMNHSKKTKNTP